MTSPVQVCLVDYNYLLFIFILGLDFHVVY